MSRTIDARGLACPQPVVLTKKALDEDDDVTVIVSDPISKENIARFGKNKGYVVTTADQGSECRIRLTRATGAPAREAAATIPQLTGEATVVIGSDHMGRGEEDLGRLLARLFLHTLTEVSPCPRRIILFNTGVKLAAEGSPVLDDLRALAAKGVEILVCGTCLDYFKLKEKLAAGSISNMYAIAEILLESPRTVSI